MRILKCFYDEVIRDPFGLSEELARLDAEIARDDGLFRSGVPEYTDADYAACDALFAEAGAK